MVDHPPHDLDATDRVSEEAERARVLAAVLRDQAIRADAARESVVRRHKRARVRRVAMVTSWVAMAYVWLASPSWINVKPPPEQSVAEEAQALRLNVFLQSQAIEAYRLRRGRLPDVLQEAGPPFSGMFYHRRDNRFYELQGRSDRVRLRYESEQSPFEFVGPAAGLLGPVPAAPSSNARGDR